MSAETEMRALLVADAAVAALVADRISADRIEQGSQRPFVVFTRTNTNREKTLDGTIVGVLVSMVVQCWADTRQAADALADAVQDVIEEQYHTVSSRESDYDGDLDLEAAMLSVEWWES